MTETINVQEGAKHTTVIHPYGGKRRVQLSFDKQGRTKQAFKKECDINQIMAKYQKTGAITHFAKNSPSYGDVTSQDFQESMEIITKAQQLFDDLPSSIRDKFGGSPGAFLDFVQNPDNLEEMQDLGLASSTKEPEPRRKPSSDAGADEADTPPTPTTDAQASDN